MYSPTITYKLQEEQLQDNYLHFQISYLVKHYLWDLWTIFLIDEKMSTTRTFNAKNNHTVKLTWTLCLTINKIKKLYLKCLSLKFGVKWEIFDPVFKFCIKKKLVGPQLPLNICVWCHLNFLYHFGRKWPQPTIRYLDIHKYKYNYSDNSISISE